MSKAVVELMGLTKYYGKHRGIEDISFEVEEGEIFGFIGPNGAGKSTTIRTLLALIFPTSGSARVFGMDCVKHAPEIAKYVGYLPSEVFFYDRMKGIELLRYAASFFPQDCEPRIRELARRLDLDLGRRIEELSYGNKKKVGIIQGLLHSPKLIILDEPTGGLDPLMQQTFFELLREENEKGATILFSSHVLSEVQRVCGRVAIVKEGRLVQVQRIEALKGERYKKCHLVAEAEIGREALETAGVTNLEINGNAASFLFKGDINGIVGRLHGLRLVDLSIEEPTLEEIFLHYYA